MKINTPERMRTVGHLLEAFKAINKVEDHSVWRYTALVINERIHTTKYPTGSSAYFEEIESALNKHIVKVYKGVNEEYIEYSLSSQKAALLRVLNPFLNEVDKQGKTIMDKRLSQHFKEGLTASFTIDTAYTLEGFMLANKHELSQTYFVATTWDSIEDNPSEQVTVTSAVRLLKDQLGGVK